MAAHNRIGKTITFTEKSIIRYSASTIGVTDETQLQPGDLVEIEFAGAEGEMTDIFSVTIVPSAN